MAVGIKDIAAELNLGLSTVAQALRGTGTISPRTRQMVVDHAARLGYLPNRNAQRMRGGKSGVIGLIVPDVVLSPYVEFVQHLFQLVERNGQELQIALTEFYDQLEDRAFRSMVASRVDGIIAKVGFSRWEDVPAEHYLRRAKAEGIPIVLYSNPIEGSGLPFIVNPMQQSTRLVVRHLVSLGHRNVAALVPAVRPFGSSMRIWLTAIREELAACDANLRLEVCGLHPGSVGIEGPTGVFNDYVNQNHPRAAIPAGRQLFQEAMTLKDRPTALIAYTDPVAIGTIFEAQAQGFRVGRDIAIAGCGQIPSSFCTPISLTSVDRRPLVYAQKLVDLLTAHMSKPSAADLPNRDEVEPLLVIGESTVGG